MNIDNLVGGLEHLDYDFPFSWEFHDPNWRTHIFQRGRYTTNQSRSCWRRYENMMIEHEILRYRIFRRSQQYPTIPLWKHIFELGRYLTHLDPLSLGAVGSQMGSLMEPLSAFSDGRHWVCSRCANFPRGLRHGSLWTLWLWWGEGSHPISGAGIATWSVSACSNPNLWLKSCAVCLWYPYDMFVICLWYVYDMFMICLWYVYGW